jgi:signal transduction histidine kinase
MWSRVAQIALRAHLEHRRVRGAAAAILLVRLVEAAACWGIVSAFFGAAVVPAQAVHLTFGIYGLANLLLFIRHRRQALTPRLVWLDMAANLLPVAAAAHWSGGIYSPLLPIFVLKISCYGLLYGVDVGLQSLVATAAVLGALAMTAWLGFGAAPIEQMPFRMPQRLTLTFATSIFALGVGGFFRTFLLLQDREARLHEAVREKDRLYQESLWHQQQLRRLSRRTMQASEDTMRRLARELHDDLGQALTAIKMELGWIELSAESSVRPHLQAARDQIGAVLQSVRNLSQLLRPAVLDDLGVVAAMQSYVAGFEQHTHISVTLENPPPETRLPPPIEVAIYRVLQEALTNVARHAKAQHVSVQLQTTRDTATLRIADDGCGFDAAAFLRHPPAEHGMGVLGMRERAATHGGEFTIESRPGAGTQLNMTIALAAAAETSEPDHGKDSRLAG